MYKWICNMYKLKLYIQFTKINMGLSKLYFIQVFFVVNIVLSSPIVDHLFVVLRPENIRTFSILGIRYMQYIL